MGGFELRIWRRGMGWTQERAAEELGVELRTYWNWEKTGCSRTVELATTALSFQQVWPDTAVLLRQLSVLARH